MSPNAKGGKNGGDQKQFQSKTPLGIHSSSMAGSKMFKSNNLMINAATTATNDALGKVLNSLNGGAGSGMDQFPADFPGRNHARGGSYGPPPMNQLHPAINDYLNSKVPEPPSEAGNNPI